MRAKSFETGGSSVENIEALDKWRELKTMAPMQAEHEIKNIEGFDDMNVVEQIASLRTLLETLANDNQNRFVAEIIAHRIRFMEDTIESEQDFAELGVAA